MMQEAGRWLGRIQDQVQQRRDLDGQSENADALLAPGRIEKLVQTGRTPVQIGLIGVGDAEMQPYYQVPPKGFDPKQIERVFQSAGVYWFVSKNGDQKMGSTFTLTEEQAREVDERVAAEKARLGLPLVASATEGDLELERNSGPSYTERLLNTVKESRLAQALLGLLPSEQEKRAALDLVERLETIQAELSTLECEVRISGSVDLQTDVWTSTIILEAPRTNMARVMHLINKAGIRLPDQTEWKQAGEEVLTILTDSVPYLAAKLVARDSITQDVVLYEGTGWDSDFSDRIKIK